MKRIISGIEINTKCKTIKGCNNIGVEYGTTGLCGGDGGHGSITYIKMRDVSGTFWKIKKGRRNYSDDVEIMLFGDSELLTMIEAYRTIANGLEEMAQDKTRGEYVSDK